MKIWLPAIRTNSGADVFVQRLAQGLQRSGHEAVVQWFPHLRELSPWRLSSVEPPAGTQIVHAGPWQGFAFKRTGLPLVVTEHQYIGHPVFRAARGVLQGLYHDAIVRRWVARSYAAADALVAVSETVAQAMRRDHAREIEVVPNWVDSGAFSAEPADELHAPLRVLVVGNAARHKGADLVLPLARELGDGVELQWLCGLRGATHGDALPPNVRRLAPRPPEAMPALYAQADLVAVLSRYEAFGYVALEAMSCARPVAGFATTGVAEVAGDCALLVPTGDVAALAAALRQLGTDPDLRRRLAISGRRRAMRDYGEARAIQAYVSVYERCLRANSVR